MVRRRTADKLGEQVAARTSTASTTISSTNAAAAKDMVFEWTDANEGKVVNVAFWLLSGGMTGKHGNEKQVEGQMSRGTHGINNLPKRCTAQALCRLEGDLPTEMIGAVYIKSPAHIIGPSTSQCTSSKTLLGTL